MQVRLVGAVELRTERATFTVSAPQLCGLVAVLALRVGSTVSAARLMEFVWGDRTPSANALQVAIAKIRRLLADLGEPEAVLTRPTGYELLVEREAVDVLRFEHALDRARHLGGDWTGVIGVLEPALADWTGEPLAGAPDTPSLVAERTRLEELHRVAVEDLAHARIECGEYGRVVPDLEVLVAEEPLRERRWALLMRSLYGSGRQADALAVYQRARTALVEAVGSEPGAELRRLYDAALNQDDSLAPIENAPDTAQGRAVGAAFRRRGNLRHPVRACIGRSHELAVLLHLVGERRLVTIVGPGGVGKTRIALEIALAQAETTHDGVWWVDLASTNEPGHVIRAVHDVLDLSEAGSEPGSSLDAVSNALADRDVLLVLDNCEHVLIEAAAFVSAVLARCPNLRVLATSREALRISAESAFPLGPLDPADAAELFQARVSMPIDGDPVTADVVREICQELDHLPLAIELAAARTQHLRLDELLERLADRFGVLNDGVRDAPAHQRNLAAVAAWSYDLLDEPERLVFERLSVFGDGATLAAALVVCEGDGVGAAENEESVRRLVDKSLVVADRSGSATRYRMLQTLAEFASRRLDTRGGRHAARRAHAEWVRELARTVGWGARIKGQTVATIHAEDAAVRDAIAWSAENDADLALEICDDLAPYWFGAMRVSVGWDLIRTAIDAPGPQTPARRASLLAWAVVFATWTQQSALADRFADEAWEHQRVQGDRERLGRLCVLRAMAAVYRPDVDVEEWAALAREHLAAAGATVGRGHLYFAEGAGLLVAGDVERAAERLREAIDTLRAEVDELGLVTAFSCLGELAWRVGDIDLFADAHADLLELGQASRTQGVVTGATARLAIARLHQGDIELAQRLARSALDGIGDSFMPIVNGYAFHAAGVVDIESGHVPEGRAELALAIEAFVRGAGAVGVAQAALCWIELARSHAADGDLAAARSAADSATELARASGDPWVLERAASTVSDVYAATT
jgi:predicted ATPase/DNA-binding SARP family transcriptional activator